MEIKKILLTGTCALGLSLLGACSDDSSSGPGVDVVEGDSSSSCSGSGETQSSPSQLSSSVVDETIPQMAITEIMYNAPDGSELEWVEVTITSGPDISSMLASNLRLDGAISFTFPNQELKKGEYIVVTNDVAKFKEEYPTFSGRLFGPWDNDPSTGEVAKLSNEGDVIDVKLSGDGDVSCSYSKDPPWPSLANGKGRTLVYKGGNAAQATSWGASKKEKGNPGVGNDEWVETSNVRLNEIMPSVNGQIAWVELYNAGTEEVDVKGWTFESKVRNEKLTITKGVVPAGGYLVLDGATDFDSAGVTKELVVSDIGGAYYLYGATLGDESSLLLPSSKYSSGVVDLSDGSTAQGALKEASKGAANTTLYIGSVVINEIHYHPNPEDLNDVEFLELKNTSDSPVTLYEKLTNGSRGWKVEGINLEFAATDILPANGFAVLFPESLSTAMGEANLRKRCSLDDAVLVKFYKGKLSNRGELIAVKKPYAKIPDASEPSMAQWFYDWSDASLYSDNWSDAKIDYKRTDGFGFSLQRVDYTTMGYEASAWTAAKPTPGK